MVFDVTRCCSFELQLLLSHPRACSRKQSLIQEPSLAKEGLFQDQIDFNQLFPSFPYISSELREDCNFHCNQSVNGVSSFCKLHSTILLISLITKRQNGWDRWALLLQCWLKFCEVSLVITRIRCKFHGVLLALWDILIHMCKTLIAVADFFITICFLQFTLTICSVFNVLTYVEPILIWNPITIRWI